MVLLVVILSASVFAFYGLKSDTTAAGNDRLMRQLFDCAEEGLAQGKQYFSQPSQRTQWSTYFTTDVRSLLPVPPAALGTATLTPLVAGSGYPLEVDLNVGGGAAPSQHLRYFVGIYNNPGDVGIAQSPIVDTDNRVMVISRCAEVLADGKTTTHFRTVQALLSVPTQPNGDYFGQAGGGFRGQGNTNNGF